MRTLIVATLLVAVVATLTLANCDGSCACGGKQQSIPRIGSKAPSFQDQPALLPNGDNDGKIGKVSIPAAPGKWTVLFFYPLDFTFVCPTEIIEYSNSYAKGQFPADTEVIGVSVDSVFSHLAWTKQARTEGGLGRMAVPLVGDITKKIAKAYGILIEEGPDAGVALRATFVIDPTGVLRSVVVNDLPCSRNIDDTVRVVAALQHADKHGVVCPAKWKAGDAIDLVPDPEKSKEYFRSRTDL